MSNVDLTKYEDEIKTVLYIKEVREVLTAVLPRRDSMTIKEFDDSIDFHIKEMGKELANTIHLGLQCGYSLEDQIEHIKRRGSFS